MSNTRYLYLRNGNVWTGDRANEKAEAVIIAGGKIAAVGSVKQLDCHPFASESVCYDLNGVTVMPGMSDSHIHVLTSSKAMQSVDLSEVKSVEDVCGKLREKAASVASETWIYGTSLNETCWDIPVVPHARDIDKADIPNPVLIHRICTHATIANTKALELSGIKSLDLKGIHRDSDGNPTGVLVEGAQLPAHNAMKKSLYTRETLLEYVDFYLKHAASLGLTTLHSCSAESLGMEENLGLYQDLMDDSRLNCRVYNVHDSLSAPAMGGIIGNDFVRFEGFKLFTDGSLGSRTAALSSPYSDDPATSGMLIHETEELFEKICESTGRNDHILIHAIGDGAIDQSLDVIERACSVCPNPKYPYLLNHVEICRPDQLERMSKLPVACVIQPTYVASDIDMVPSRLGAREKYACMWKDFIEAGIPLCGSSDAPIEILNPMYGIWSLVNRTSYDGKRTWNSAQKITLDQALHVYTTNPARAYSTWAWNGSITPGKSADLVILDRDIFKTPDMEIKDIKVRNTLLEGKLSYGTIAGWDFCK